MNLQPRPVTVPLDRAMAERIVESLLTNGERHTPADAQLWLSVAPTATGAELVVADDGPGVAHELRETLFEPFRQGPEAGHRSAESSRKRRSTSSSVLKKWGLTRSPSPR